MVDLWWKSWLKLQANPAYYREADRVVDYFPEKLRELVGVPAPMDKREAIRIAAKAVSRAWHTYRREVADRYPTPTFMEQFQEEIERLDAALRPSTPVAGTPEAGHPDWACPGCAKAGRLSPRDHLFQTAQMMNDADKLCPCKGTGRNVYEAPTPKQNEGAE